MKLEKFKEKNNKKVGIILFTITCVLLISGVILYRTFAIFETNDIFNIINGEVKDEGNIRFMVYVDNELQKSVPNKESGYSLDTSSSYCENGEIISWNDEKWSVEIKDVSTTKTKCYLYFKEIYKEGILNGAIPYLGNGRLVPITISDSEKPSDVNYTNNENKYGGKVRKADITTSWYSYGEHRWANAIILKDGEVDHYKPGEEIQESAIESYFVWIPRYSYKLKEDESAYSKYTSVESVGIVESASKFYETHPNQATSNAFEITFETKNSGVQNGTSKGSEYTHPAFLSFNSNGMWVGKFETGYNQNSSNENVTSDESWSTTGAEQNEEQGEKVIIKPNVYSWRNINVSNAFYTSFDYQRELESHMMKNTEWGAVAYLTQSKYGRCTEKEGKVTCEEARINNSSNYVTGVSNKNEPTCSYTGDSSDCNKYESIELNQDGNNGWIYYNSNSQIASTTGNYTGIYDMVGSAWEYVMGVMQSSTDSAIPATGSSSTENSGFKGPYSNGSGINDNGLEFPSNKYYDLYEYGTSQEQYQRGHLGDGTKEFGKFYYTKYIDNSKPIRYIGSYNVDLAYFVSSVHPWFMRGGSRCDGTDAGIFSFLGRTGNEDSDFSFRVVLTP